MLTVNPKVEFYRPLAEKYALFYKVLEPNEILAIICNESQGDPNATNPSDPSWGLLGVSTLIAWKFGPFGAQDTSWHADPDKNVRAGAGFLAYLKQEYAARFPNYAWVAAYNAGEPKFLHGFVDAPYVQSFLGYLALLDGVKPQDGPATSNP